MTHAEAYELATQVRWVSQPCFAGEECWCRIIMPEEPIQYGEDDVEEVCIVSSGSINQSMAEHIVNKGYNKAKEKYKFTEEQARQIWKAGQEYWKTSGDSITFEELTERFQSLSQPKMPIGFECEINNPMFALTIEPKTTTNSQGQIVWVGKYIY